jgi:hypothetical protein
VEPATVSSSLHARARAFVRAFEAGAPMPEPFDALACDVARFQASAIPGYARLCRARGVEPSALRAFDAIPPVPTDAFRVTRVATFAPFDGEVVLKTSGTTADLRGTHVMRDLETYDAASLAFGRKWLARDLDRKVPVFVLGPSPEQTPDSSLIHMCATFVRALGQEAPASETYVVHDGIVDLGPFDERVARAHAEGVPVLVLGTSFAFVHFVDALGDATFELPRGSRVMQTGGYKGKSREVPKEKLTRELARVFGIPARSIVAEYGMTELTSQFYEQTLFDADARPGVFVEPPWARVVPVDPETLATLADGEIGLAKIVDLMNVDSAVAILTHDRVRRVAGGFELHGRASGAPARGCSIAMDELLEGSQSER